MLRMLNVHKIFGLVRRETDFWDDLPSGTFVILKLLCRIEALYVSFNCYL